jgi:hypothetical protein
MPQRMRQILSIFFLLFLQMLFSYFAFSAEDWIPDLIAPKTNKLANPHVLEYSKKFQEKFRVLPYQGGGELLIPTELTTLDADQKYKTLEELEDGSLLKIVAYQDEKGKMALFCGSKKESKILAKRILPEAERKVLVTLTNQKTGEKTSKLKSKTLHHTSFNNWRAVNTAGVLYKTDGVVYFYIESGSYDLNWKNKRSRELSLFHLHFVKKLLKMLYGVESDIIKKTIYVKKINPGSLFPVEKIDEIKEKFIKAKRFLLKIKTMPS